MDEKWHVEDLVSGPHKVALAVVAGDVLILVLDRSEWAQAQTMCAWRNETLRLAYPDWTAQQAA
jgi:hypothetical protein